MGDREANAELTWPDNCGAVNAQLDSTASCSICNDFYDTPLVLPCGHSFCSNCIRSYVSHQQGQAKCPQCRAACDERDLRPNTGLRDLVDKLLQARPAYIAALRNQKTGFSRLVKASAHSQQQTGVSEQSGQVTSHKRQLRSSKGTPDAALATAAAAEAIVIEESPRKRQRSSADVASSQPAPVKGTATASADVAACPICNRTFKAGRVLEAHVNRCIDNPPAKEQPEQMQQQELQPQRVVRKVPKGTPQVKVPAKIAFHLFNDKKLKDKLKDANLPVHGKRKELEDRYNRLRLEVQLAADKGEAASEAELVRRAMAKEKTVNPVKGFFVGSRTGLKAAGSGADASDDPDMSEVEFHSFPALIKATRERDAARKAKQQEAQLPAQSTDAGPDAAAAVHAPEHASESPAHAQTDEQQADLQAAHQTSAEGQHVNGHMANGVKSKPAQYPAGPQTTANAAEHHAEAPMPQTSRPLSSNVPRRRSQSEDPAQTPMPSNAGRLEAGSHAERQGPPADLAQQNARVQNVPADQAQHDDRVDITTDAGSDKLSEDDLHIDLDDQHAQPASHHVQDQRVLQQLQLLNKAAIAQPKLSLSLDKDAAMPQAHRNSALSSTDRLVPRGHVDALDALDCIVEDTDSDIEGRVA